jgi:hypothetical protein
MLHSTHKNKEVLLRYESGNFSASLILTYFGSREDRTQTGRVGHGV